MGATVPKKQRFCIYCGGAGLTKEHLYADWLGEHIPSRVDMHGIHFVIVNPQTTSESSRIWPGDTHARKIRRVCGVCNSGWMSQLQEATKPYLLPMLKGETTTISRRAQKTVSAWATMFTMTSEFLGNSDEFVAIPQSQRDYVRLNRRTPRGWRIWIGRYRWAKGVERWTHHVMCLADDGEQRLAGDTSEPPNTQTTTICIGNHLVIHVMSSAVGPGQRIIRNWRFPPQIAPGLRQICPAAAQTVHWPPGHILQPRELHYVANTFFDRCSAILQREMLGRTS
jgi:hypothetical protein